MQPVIEQHDRIELGDLTSFISEVKGITYNEAEELIPWMYYEGGCYIRDDQEDEEWCYEVVMHLKDNGIDAIEVYQDYRRCYGTTYSRSGAMGMNDMLKKHEAIIQSLLNDEYEDRGLELLRRFALEQAEEIQRLRELLNFALDGLDSIPRSWGLKITHSEKIRKRLDQEQGE
jgi:hypothetical protein